MNRFWVIQKKADFIQFRVDRFCSPTILGFLLTQGTYDPRMKSMPSQIAFTTESYQKKQEAKILGGVEFPYLVLQIL